MRTVTCKNAQCEDYSIFKGVPDDDTPVSCGVCGVWIIEPTGEPIWEVPDL